MNRILASYFFYTRSERRGVMLLLLLSLGFLVLPQLYKAINRRSASTDFTAFKNEIAVFAAQQPLNTEGGYLRENDRFKDSKPTRLFTFNPNDVTFDELITLGLPPRVAKTWLNYTTKGGHFRQTDDIKRIYGLTSHDFERLRNYINIENDAPNGNSYHTKQDFDTRKVSNYPPQYTTAQDIVLQVFDPNTASESVLRGLGLEANIVKNLLKYRERGGRFYRKEDLKKLYDFSEIDFLRLEKYIQIVENQKLGGNPASEPNPYKASSKADSRDSYQIDVNSATLDEWLQLRGVGNTFASRITQYRESLGGFATLEQIKDVHGISDSIWRTLTPHLKLSAPIFRKLQVNKLGNDVVKHPYVSSQQAKVLVRYRQNHGDFRSIEDVRKTGIFNEETLRKLSFYIEYN
jgi:competence protein ComEA